MPRGQSELSYWEWIIGLGIVAFAVTIVKAVGLGEGWEHACVYSVILFVFLIIALRPAWGFATLWRRLIVIFLLHSTIVFSIMRVLPPQSPGIHGFPALVAVLAEGLVVLRILQPAILLAFPRHSKSRRNGHSMRGDDC
jgi:hypothetical protein